MRRGSAKEDAMNLFMLAAALVDEKQDALKELVLTFMASYLGIAGGISLLIELVKMLSPKWTTPKAPALTIILTFLLGASAKLLLPDVYGPNTFKAWILHGTILVFVSVIAAVFHDKFWNVVKGKLGGLLPGGDDTTPPPGTTDAKPPGPPAGAGDGGTKPA
jgi:hypothetical protein